MKRGFVPPHGVWLEEPDLNICFGCRGFTTIEGPLDADNTESNLALSAQGCELTDKQVITGSLPGPCDDPLPAACPALQLLGVRQPNSGDRLELKNSRMFTMHGPRPTQ